MKAPDTIYLQWHGDNLVEDLEALDAATPTPRASDVSWCPVQIYDIDVRYVRADRVREEVNAERSNVDVILAELLMKARGPFSDNLFACDRMRLDARAALDELLPGAPCSSLCAPGSGERCMVTDDGQCGS